MTIPALPANPSRTDLPDAFITKANNWVAALTIWTDAANALGLDVTAKQLLAAQSVIDAAAQVALATNQANIATTQAAAAVSGVNAIAWVSGTTYTDGQVRYSPIDRRTYRRIGNGAGTTDPSLDNVNWILISVGPSRSARVTRTTNIVLGVADSGTFIDITSGTFTQTFAAAATLGNGWFVRIGNSGTGDITIPSSDGLTNWVMYSNEVRDFYCDGTVFTSKVVAPYRRDFLTSGTWTKPPGYTSHAGILWSGGSGGARSGSGGTVQGTAGGGSFPFTVFGSALTSTVSVTIGAGGAAIVSPSTGNGNSGGSSSFGSYVTVAGGTNSTPGSVTIAGAQMSSTSGDGFGSATYLSGNSLATVWSGTIAGSTVACAGTVYGGGGGGGVNSPSTLLAAGVSLVAGAGGAATLSTTAGDGAAPSGAGGGTQTGTQSGAGARGELRIWGVA